MDILKTGLKAARQQPNQDISAFLCDIRTLGRRIYRAFLHLEQIVLTSFIEGLSDATLRWELRKSKPATADDALAMAIEMNSFLEIKRGAPSTSEMAQISVNAISREAPEPSTKEWMDELVRTPTEGFKNAMPKSNQELSRQRSSTSNRNQPSRSNSTDSQGNRTVRFQKNSDERRNNSDRGNNRRQNSTARIRPLTGPIATKTVPKDPANIVNAKIMPQTNAKPVSSVERLDTSAMSAEVTLTTF